MKIEEIITKLPFETLRDLRIFIRSANNVRRLSRACSPETIKEAVMLERRKRVAIESIREDWRNKIISEDIARKAIDFIYSTTDKSIEEAYQNLKECLTRL